MSFARRRQFRSALGALILLASCTHSQDSKHPKLNSRTIRVQAPIALDDDTATILARPSYVSSDSAGRIFVADRSDKDIKLYTATGKRIGHIGRAGAGPGEFEYLATAQVMGDSLVAYDVIKRRLTLFDRLGRVGRVVTLEANTFDIRVVDDSLLLLIRHPSAHGKLLKLIHRDGSVVSEFFTLDNFFDDPQLRYLTALWADARDGYVFVNIFGEDSLFVFDYAGHRVAAGTVPATAPLGSMKRALALAGGKTRGPDGTWFNDGIAAVTSLLALDDGLVALQVDPYDTKVGLDLVEGGDIVIVDGAGGSLKQRAVGRLTAGLVGRAANGDPLFLTYTDSTHNTVAVERWNLR